MSEERTNGEAYRSRMPLWFPIYGSHLKRVGFARAFVGGGAMYLSIPFFLLTHVSGTTYALHFAVAPLLGLPQIQAKKYLIVDRYKVDGLPAFDRFNCVFCGYANGLCMLLHARLDQIGEADVDASLLRRLAAGAIAVSYLPAAALTQAGVVSVIYDQVISPVLGMKPTSQKKASRVVRDLDYAAGHGALSRRLLRFEKTFALRLRAALEQIESAWCPIKHFERMDGVVYPPHHKNFFEPHQIAHLRETLLQEGTVSAFKPSSPSSPQKKRRRPRLPGLASLLRVRG